MPCRRLAGSGGKWLLGLGNMERKPATYETCLCSPQRRRGYAKSGSRRQATGGCVASSSLSLPGDSGASTLGYGPKRSVSVRQSNRHSWLFSSAHAGGSIASKAFEQVKRRRTAHRPRPGAESGPIILGWWEQHKGIWREPSDFRYVTHDPTLCSAPSLLGCFRLRSGFGHFN